jgi:hypothetical protein
MEQLWELVDGAGQEVVENQGKGSYSVCPPRYGSNPAAA